MKNILHNIQAVKSYLSSRVLSLSRDNAKQIYAAFRIPQLDSIDNRVNICIGCRGVSIQDSYWIKKVCRMFFMFTASLIFERRQKGSRSLRMTSTTQSSRSKYKISVFFSIRYIADHHLRQFPAWLTVPDFFPSVYRNRMVRYLDPAVFKCLYQAEPDIAARLKAVIQVSGPYGGL